MVLQLQHTFHSGNEKTVPTASKYLSTYNRSIGSLTKLVELSLVISVLDFFNFIGKDRHIYYRHIYICIQAAFHNLQNN